MQNIVKHFDSPQPTESDVDSHHIARAGAIGEEEAYEEVEAPDVPNLRPEVHTQDRSRFLASARFSVDAVGLVTQSVKHSV